MRIALLLVPMLAGCGQPAARTGGIVSTNPCADAILIRLVAADRIAAISHYSQQPSATSIPIAIARRFRATAGTAEEVIALKPDLVLTSSFTPMATRAAYDSAGLKTLLLGSPTTIAASEDQVTQIAVAVGEPARGRAMNAAIERAVARFTYRPNPSSLDPSSPRRRGSISAAAGESSQRPAAMDPRLRGDDGSGLRRNPAALLYIAGDLVNGSGTLLDEMMTRAGFTNAAATYGLAFTGTLPAENLVGRPPAIVIAPDGRGRASELRRRLLPTTPIARFDRSLVNCGGPTIVPAMARLAAIRASLR